MSLSSESATRISVGGGITPEDLAATLIGETGPASEAVAQYALRLGDDSLMLAQRLGWWISRAPELEEDVALGNIALDLLGHARFFLTYAGTAWGKTEDELAYFRAEEDFRSSRLVEQENGDFAQTMARQLLFSQYALLVYTRLESSTDATLAAVAAKARREVRYHVDHASEWVLRLGDGTETSRERMQRGLDRMWPYVDELFAESELYDALEGIAVRPSTFRAEYDARVSTIIEQATLRMPTVPQAMHDDRRGGFSEYRGYILAEMQVLARQHPGATW